MADDAPDISFISNVEFSDDVAYKLLDEAEKLGQITEAESKFVKAKYKKLHDAAVANRLLDQQLTRRNKILASDILSEQIMIEKVRIEETEEYSRLQQAGEIRSSIQKELEYVEQKETMAKFELFELKRVHEELTNSLAAMKNQNSQLVDPVLEKLRKEANDLTEHYDITEENYEKEITQKNILKAQVADLETMEVEKQGIIKAKNDSLRSAEMEPGRLERQIASMENAASTMENEKRGLARKLKNYEHENESQAKRRGEAEKLRKSIQETLELKRQTLEEREQDVGIVRSNLDKAKSKCHELETTKLEIMVNKKELDSKFRHVSDLQAIANKEYEVLKRQLKKKRVVADSVRHLLPEVEGNLKDQEAVLKNNVDEKHRKAKDIQRLKDEVDEYMSKFLQQEGIESDKKQELETTINEVDELEADVMQWLAEQKRQGKLLSVLSAQRDIKSRELARIEAKEKEGKQQVRIKELVIVDLTKRCNELSNRLKEFSALYEVVKNERNKYVNLIQSSAQALAEMREKIRILHNEVEILGNERMAKDMALSKEMNAHSQAQNQRDSLRQDLNRLLSEYRTKQSTVEQQIQEIDKLNVVINSLEKDMLQLKSKYERSVEERNVTGVQLIDRNDELCILYERSNQQQEALRRGEIESIKKEEELRMVRLQSEELKHQYGAAKLRIPELEANKEKISELEENLKLQRKITEELSNKLEDPSNLERWRPLDGNDPDIEQLSAKIKVLEDRLDHKREVLLEKELVLEEVSALTEKLRSQAVAKRDAAKLLADELNELQNKIRDTTKKMLATVSELSMYQATALRLQQEKLHREKCLEEAKWRYDHGEAPTEDAVKELNRAERKRIYMMEAAMRREEEMLMVHPSSNLMKTAAEPRPTAYIPDELGIPKPYGNLAPFKPTEPGSTMRHIKMPQIKAIEI
eukprot:gene7169-9772_t